MEADFQISISEIRDVLPQIYYFGSEIRVNPLKESENLTLCVEEVGKGKKRVFRISRPGYHDKIELQSEFIWMEEISRDTTLALPQVYKGYDGEYIQHFTSSLNGVTYTCCMFSFLEGQMVGQLHGEQLLSQIRNTGKILAVLHSQWQNRHPDIKLKRFSWDLEDLLGANARYGHWHDYKELTTDTVILIEKAVDIIKKRISAFGKGKDIYGMIHADLHSSNIIINNGVLQIFDFDDCGYGWFLYDFGCSLVEYSNGLEELVKALTEGYETVKTLTDEDKKEIDTFVLLRRIIRMAWLSGHANSDTAKSVGSGYFKKTCDLAEIYVAKFSNCAEI